MATSIYAGNPPPNVVRWIEDNVKDDLVWGFDITKTNYAGKYNVGYYVDMVYSQSGYNTTTATKDVIYASRTPSYGVGQILFFRFNKDFEMSEPNVGMTTSFHRNFVGCGWMNDGYTGYGVSTDQGGTIYTKTLTDQYDWEHMAQSDGWTGGVISTNGAPTFSADGTKVLAIENVVGTVVSESSHIMTMHTLANAFDAGETSGEGIPVYLSDFPESGSATFRAAKLSPDGRTVLLMFNRRIDQYTLENAYDIKGGKTFIGSIDTYTLAGDEGGEFQMFWINESATKLVIFTFNTTSYYAFDLSK